MIPFMAVVVLICCCRLRLNPPIDSLFLSFFVHSTNETMCCCVIICMVYCDQVPQAVRVWYHRRWFSLFGSKSFVKRTASNENNNNPFTDVKNTYSTEVHSQKFTPCLHSYITNVVTISSSSCCCVYRCRS